LAIIIQFHQVIAGFIHFGGFAQAFLAGAPKQAAIQNHQLNVGVINNLKKLVGLSIHKYHQAQSPGQHHFVSELQG
jgi:hypothetical protein